MKPGIAGRRVASALLLFWAAAAWAATATVDPQQYLEDVRYLASEKLKGRGTGTPELEKAADYIAGRFREFGLQAARRQELLPGVQRYHQRQARERTTGSRTPRTGGRRTLKFREDFIPFNFSAGGELSGPVVFAGLRHHRERVPLRRLRRPRRQGQDRADPAPRAAGVRRKERFRRAGSTPSTRSSSARPATPRCTARAA